MIHNKERNPELIFVPTDKIVLFNLNVWQRGDVHLRAQHACGAIRNAL